MKPPLTGMSNDMDDDKDLELTWVEMTILAALGLGVVGFIVTPILLIMFMVTP